MSVTPYLEEIPQVTARIGAYRVSAGVWAIRVSEDQTHVTVAYMPTAEEAHLLAGHLRRWMGVR